MRRTFIAIGAGVVIAALAVMALRNRPVAPLPDSWAPTLEALPAPSGLNTAEPQLTSEGGRVILSWLELHGRHTTLKFAERTAESWSDTRTVASGEDFMVNSADVPSVRLLGDGTIVAHWLQDDPPTPESYKIRLTWSKDGGRTWSPAIYPHHDTVHAQHGFVTMFQAPGAGVGLVWLDGRSENPDVPEAFEMALRATVFGSDGKQGEDVVVDSRVCECCPTAAAATSEGVIVAYRDRDPDEIRDIYVTRLVDGKWSDPVPVHKDGWEIFGCPVNGPAIGARERDVVVAWFNAKTDPGHTFVAFSHDAGHTFGPPVRVDEAASLGRVGAELLPDGSALVTWVEFNPQGSQFKARRVTSTGVAGPAVAIGASTGTRFPRVSQTGRELIFAWTETEENSPRVRTSRAALPH